MSLQGEYLDNPHRRLQEAVRSKPTYLHEHRRHAKCAVVSIPAEAAVPCITCCCGLADCEWHHAGRFDVDGTQEVCRVNGDVKRRVTEVHRSGSLTWQRDCAAGEMMGLHYSDSRLLPLLTKADIIKVEKTFVWTCEVAESACQLTSAHGLDLRRLEWFACSPRKTNILPRGGGWRRRGGASIWSLWAMNSLRNHWKACFEISQLRAPF